MADWRDELALWLAPFIERFGHKAAEAVMSHLVQRRADGDLFSPQECQNDFDAAGYRRDGQFQSILEKRCSYGSSPILTTTDCVGKEGRRNAMMASRVGCLMPNARGRAQRAGRPTERGNGA